MKLRPRLKRSLFLAHLVFASVLVATSCEDQPNFVVTTDTVCHCDGGSGVDDPCAGHLDRWRYVVDKLHEVSARDFKGEFIGTKCQGEAAAAWDWFPFFFNSWQPVDGYKHNMLGTLHHFNWNYDDDEDWNLHVHPTSDFSDLISNVEALHDDSKDEHDCVVEDDPDLKCMEAEISPDQELWSNPWFFIPGSHPNDADEDGYSWLQGREMGFYGPWIVDANHDSKAEIHPAQMIWFKDHFARGVSGDGPPLDVFWLMFMQDNTGRFDDRNNFDCDGDAPAGWRPWTDSPVSGQIDIAFEVDPKTEVVNFSIEELFKRFVVTSADSSARQDADDGKSHALQYNGRVVVRVDENQPNDDDLGVMFTNLCLGSDGKLRGFLSVRSKVGGNDDKGEEGFHILYVARSVGTDHHVPRPPLADFPHVLATAEQLGSSLKNNGDQLTGDLQLNLHGNQFTTDRDFTVAKVEFNGDHVRQELKFEQDRKTHAVRISDLPLVNNAKLTITTASGVKLRVRTPVLAPLPFIKESVIRSAIDAEAGRFLSASVGGVRGVALPNDKKLSVLQEVQLQLNPRYAPYKGSEVSDASSSSFASEINKAIVENQQAKLQQLFNSTHPFSVAWTFEATDLSTGKPYPVSTEKTGGDGVQVEVSSGAVANDTLKIRFASAASAGIIELRAKVTVVDTLGHTTTVERRVWSHGFESAGKNIGDWVRLIQALSGVRDVALNANSAQPKPADFILVPEAKRTRVDITTAYLREIVRDKRISIEELRNIVRFLKTAV